MIPPIDPSSGLTLGGLFAVLATVVGVIYRQGVKQISSDQEYIRGTLTELTRESIRTQSETSATMREVSDSISALTEQVRALTERSRR